MENLVNLLDYLKQKTKSCRVGMLRKNDCSIEFEFVWFYEDLVCRLNKSLPDEVLCETIISDCLIDTLIKEINKKHKEWMEETKSPTA